MLFVPSNRRQAFLYHTKMTGLECFVHFLLKKKEAWTQKSVLSQIDKP